MRFLIIGGGGFLGSHLSQALITAGHYVRIFDTSKARYLNFSNQSGAEVVLGDFLDQDDLNKAMIDIDQVFHLAYTTVPQTSNNDPQFDIETNLLGTLRILEAIQKAKIKKIIFPSSGGTVYGVPREIPINENHPIEPISSYGITKFTVERYLHLFWKLYGLDYCILRISNAYGERQPVTKTQGVISSFIDEVLRDENVIIWGDGSVVRDYIYVSDIVRALMLASTHAGEQKVFNIGSGIGHSLIDIVNILEQVSQKPIQVRFTSRRPFDVPVNILDISHARQSLNWEPKVELLEGISRTFEYMLKDKG